MVHPSSSSVVVDRILFQPSQQSVGIHCINWTDKLLALMINLYYHLLADNVIKADEYRADKVELLSLT